MPRSWLKLPTRVDSGHSDWLHRPAATPPPPAAAGGATANCWLRSEDSPTSSRLQRREARGALFSSFTDSRVPTEYWLHPTSRDHSAIFAARTQTTCTSAPLTSSPPPPSTSSATILPSPFDSACPRNCVGAAYGNGEWYDVAESTVQTPPLFDDDDYSALEVCFLKRKRIAEIL